MLAIIIAHVKKVSSSLSTSSEKFLSLFYERVIQYFVMPYKRSLEGKTILFCADLRMESSSNMYSTYFFHTASFYVSC